MKYLKIRLLRSLENEFVEKWHKLCVNSTYGHFFNSPIWFKTCVDTYGFSEYFIFAAYKQNELVAVLPLVKSKKFGVSVLTSPGGSYVEKSTLLINKIDRNIIRKLISKVLKVGNIFLTEVPESIAAELSKNKHKSLISLISVNPYIDLKGNPFEGMTNKRRNKIANKIKKFGVELKFIRHRTDLVNPLSLIFKIEMTSSRKIEGKESFSDPIVKKLFMNLIDKAKENVVIDIMLFKDQPVVSYLGLLFKNKFLAYHTAYVKDFAYLSPGKMVVFNAVKTLSEEGVSSFDFSRGHNIFKNEFTDKYLFQYDCYITNNRIVRFWWITINLARRVKAKFFQTDRSLDGKYLFRQLNVNSGFHKKINLHHDR